MLSVEKWRKAAMRYLLVLVIAFSGAAHAVEKIIIDTDMGADVDDVGAIAVAHYYADQGQAELLGVMASIDHRGGWAAAASDAVNTYYNRPNIPLGTNRGPAGAFGGDASRFPQHIGSNSALYGHDHDTFNTAEDAVAVYRRILNGQPNNSVNIVVIGWMSNIANLMDSGANHGGDGILKTGKQLLEQKAKRLVIMGGRYPSGLEFNFKFDGPSAVKVMSNLNVPMIFTGYEVGTLIQTGETLVQTPVNNPVREAYRLYGQGREPFNRSSWDLTAVVYAVEGLSDYFSLSTAGKNRLYSDGSNSWLSGDSKGDYYLKLKDSGARYRLRDRLNNMLQSLPVSCDLNVSLTANNPSCSASNGSVDASVSGGDAPYVYTWSNGGSGASIAGLDEGLYSLSVTDSSGCSVSKDVSLSALSVTPQVQHATPTSNGSASLELSGGRSPFQYSWSNGAHTQNVSGLGAGSYSVTVEDASGCSVNKQLTVEQRNASSETYLEAECAIAVGTKWRSVESSLASDGVYLETATSTYDMGPSGLASSLLEFEFELDQTGPYSFYAHALTPNGGADSLWYRLNGGSWFAWHMGVSTAFRWKHLGIQLPFSAGTNTLEISFREGGLKLDKLFITRESSTPSGLAAPASNCTGVSCPVSGTACDDGNPLTSDDKEDGSCGCAGTLVQQCAVQGTSCDDGNPFTDNDVADGNCGCSGASSCPAAGTACDDGNSLTANDRADGRCGCSGTFPSGGDGALSFDAECSSSVGDSWKAFSSSSAAEGTAIRVAVGKYNFVANKPASSVVSFPFNHAAAERQELFLRLKAPSSSSDSLWFRLNGGNWTAWHLGASSGFQWKHWPFGVRTRAGSNNLEIAYREGGLELDKIYLSGSKVLPTGYGVASSNCGPVTCPASGSSCDDGNAATFGDVADGNCGCTGTACPAAGQACDDGDATTLGDVTDGFCGCAGRQEGAEELSLEAECAASSGIKWKSTNSTSASLGEFMAVPNNNYNMRHSGNSNAELSFPFNLSSAGQYHLMLRTLTPDGGSDSLWFQIDDGAWTPWHMGVQKTFNWKRSALAQTLAAGSHTLKIAFREGGLQLDKIYLSKDRALPAGTGPAATNCR